MMKVMCERLDENALTTDNSAAALGLDEFSLLARLQQGELKAARAKSGEMVIPESELERLAGGPMSAQSVEGGAILPDECLGIERRYGGLPRDGQIVSPYKVGDCRFSESEIHGYRVAAAIAAQLRYADDLNRQLSAKGQLPESCDFKIKISEMEKWKVRSALLNLNHGEILLCQCGDEFAVIERFHEGALRPSSDRGIQSRCKTDVGVLGQQPDREGTENRLGTIPDHRPGHIVAAISKRCHQAIANDETVSQGQKVTNSASHGVRM